MPMRETDAMNRLTIVAIAVIGTTVSLLVLTARKARWREV
jgi:hypothetical protein